MNAYEQLTTMRDFLGESSASHWKDRFLLTCLNQVQEKLAQKVAKAPGGWLVTSAAVTPVASVITLPADCAKPVYLEEQSTGKIIGFAVEVGERRLNRTPASGYQDYGVLEAYRQIGQLVVNQDSYTSACTLWYQLKCPDLHCGTADTGSTLSSIKMSQYDGPAATVGFGAKVIVDYYNGAQIAVVSGTGAGVVATISDYTTARVATVASVTTFSASSVYGTISRLPEQCHHLMWLEASMIALAKPASQMDEKIFSFLKDRWKDAEAEFIEWVSTPHIGSKRTRVTETY